MSKKQRNWLTPEMKEFIIKEKNENLDIDTTTIKKKNLNIKNNSDISNKAYELYEMLKKL